MFVELAPPNHAFVEVDGQRRCYSRGNVRPAPCYLCEQAIGQDGERAEYDAGDEGVRPIHLSCGESDNEARAEAAYFAGGQS